MDEKKETKRKTDKMQVSCDKNKLKSIFELLSYGRERLYLNRNHTLSFCISLNEYNINRKIHHYAIKMRYKESEFHKIYQAFIKFKYIHKIHKLR